jgi:hypothetical protein
VGPTFGCPDANTESSHLTTIACAAIAQADVKQGGMAVSGGKNAGSGLTVLRRP